MLRKVLQDAGYEVQTIRLATPPWHTWLVPEDYAQMVTTLGFLAHAEGFEYIALGPAATDKPETYAVIPELLPKSSNAFFSGHLTTPEGQISLPAVKACAEVIHRSAPVEKNGFANLRFAALANVPPWAPFFPAAYHRRQSASLRLGHRRCRPGCGGIWQRFLPG